MLIRPEERIHELLEIVIHIAPYGHSLILHRVQVSIIVTVIKECAVLTRVNMLGKKNQQVHVELESCRELSQKLMHTV